MLDFMPRIFFAGVHYLQRAIEHLQFPTAEKNKKTKKKTREQNLYTIRYNLVPFFTFKQASIFVVSLSDRMFSAEARTALHEGTLSKNDAESTIIQIMYVQTFHVQNLCFTCKPI